MASLNITSLQLRVFQLQNGKFFPRCKTGCVTREKAINSMLFLWTSLLSPHTLHGAIWKENWDRINPKKIIEKFKTCPDHQSTDDGDVNMWVLCWTGVWLRWHLRSLLKPLFWDSSLPPSKLIEVKSISFDINYNLRRNRIPSSMIQRGRAWGQKYIL